MIDYIRSMCWGTRGNYSSMISLDQTINDEGFSLANTIEDYRTSEVPRIRKVKNVKIHSGSSHTVKCAG